MKAKTFDRISTALLIMFSLGAIASLSVGKYQNALFNAVGGLFVWFIHLPFVERMKMNDEEIEKNDREIEELRKRREDEKDKTGS